LSSSVRPSLPADTVNHVTDYGRHVLVLYREMELRLIESLKHNLAGHNMEELRAGVEYTAWQAEKLRQLHIYREENGFIIDEETRDMLAELAPILEHEYRQGIIGERIIFDKAKEAGSNAVKGTFLRTNERKVRALERELRFSLRKANTAALRMANDAYRQTIFDVVYQASHGAVTEKQAWDMAVKQFLERGINCVEYRNGARVNIADYASMAVRTASLRSHLMGEGDFRRSIGRTLVIISKHETSCPLCRPWERKILIDDVYSGGTAKDGNYPLLSFAMEKGLYHPNCRHGMGTWYPEIGEALRQIEAEQGSSIELSHAENQVQRFRRFVEGTADLKLREKYKARLREWEGIAEKERNK